MIEDDQILNDGICYNLMKAGFEAFSAYTGKEAAALLNKSNVNLIILDIGLPDCNGVELCRKIRASHDIPVLFLTACDMEQDILNGFQAGADDYVTKPFHLSVLLERVKVVLKRQEPVGARNRLDFDDGNLKIDLVKMRIVANQTEASITPTEAKLLEVFINHPDQVLTRRLLLDKMWDQNGDFVDAHTLTVNINRLRAKFGKNPEQYIKTIYGMGYMWARRDVR